MGELKRNRDAEAGTRGNRNWDLGSVKAAKG